MMLSNAAMSMPNLERLSSDPLEQEITPTLETETEVVDSNYGSNPIVNEFIRIGAASYPNVPFEELYDLEADPYQEQNLINNPELIDVKNRLSAALENWMVTQNDFLIHEKMPLIKPTLHPLDRNSKWNKVDSNLAGKLNESDYTSSHY